MYNDAQLTMTGNVASDPEFKIVGKDIPVLKMRVAWNTRRRDPVTGEWADANSSFATVTCWRRLALNLRGCLRRGDPVFLRGRLDIRQWVGRDGQPRLSVEVEADTLGHNLLRGVASFQKTTESAGRTAAELAAAGGGAMADAELAVLGAGAGGPMFDDAAIDALAQQAASVAVASS